MSPLMRRRMRPPISRRMGAGFSLVEVVVAVLVLSIGTMAAYRTLDMARLQIGGEAARTLAATVARNRAEELKIVGAAAGRGLPREVEMGRITWTVTVDEAATAAGLVEATVRVTGAAGPGAVLVAYVPVAPDRR